jgi:hypothetical protein
LEKKVLDFKPDAVVLVIHPQDALFAMQNLAKSLRKGIEPIDEVFRQVAREARVDARTPALSAEKRLAPHWPRLIEWAYGRIAERCRREGTRAVVVYLPGLGSDVRNKDGERMIELALKAGFAVIRLDDAYGSANLESLKVAPWDAHPNTLGHKLIADGLYTALTAENVGLLGPAGSAAGKPENGTDARRETKP